MKSLWTSGDVRLQWTGGGWSAISHNQWMSRRALRWAELAKRMSCLSLVGKNYGPLARPTFVTDKSVAMGQNTLISISHLYTCKFSWQNLAQLLRWQNLAASAHFEVLITTFVIGADTVSVTRSTFLLGHAHTCTHTKTNSQGENNISLAIAAGNKKVRCGKGGEEMPYRLTLQGNKNSYDFRKILFFDTWITKTFLKYLSLLIYHIKCWFIWAFSQSIMSCC